MKTTLIVSQIRFAVQGIRAHLDRLDEACRLLEEKGKRPIPKRTLLKLTLRELVSLIRKRGLIRGLPLEALCDNKVPENLVFKGNRRFTNMGDIPISFFLTIPAKQLQLAKHAGPRTIKALEDLFVWCGVR